MTKGVAQIVVFTKLNRLKPDQRIKNGSSNRESPAVNTSKSQLRAWIMDKVKEDRELHEIHGSPLESEPKPWSPSGLF